METTLQAPAPIVGEELEVNELAVNQITKEARLLIQKIVNLKIAFEEMELQPFDQNTFSDLINGNGATKAIEQFKALAQKDTKGFKSPITRNNLLRQVDESGRTLYKCIREIKEGFELVKRQTSYDLGTEDYLVTGSAVELVQDRIREQYTTRITDRQAEVYAQLEKLGESYNGFIDYLKKEDFRTYGNPMVDHFRGRSLIEKFFAFEVTGKAWNQDDVLGPHITVNKKSLTLFK
jgi:hypothetical protein